MANPVVQLPLDLTGTNPDNLVPAEEHLLVDLDGFPYKIITLFHGGFYTKGLRVYTEQNNKYVLLRPNVDYICTYHHVELSKRTGLEICSDIVFINHSLTGIVKVQAQMVGGDLAYSFTAITDYVTWFNQQVNHVPEWIDYAGFEPIWGPGELVQKRWGLDTYQPMNNALEDIARRHMYGPAGAEEDLRQSIRDRFDQFMSRFDDRLDRHIADKANPHQSNPEKVGLGLLRNLPIATQGQANAIASNEFYLTPKLVWGANDLLSKPLYDHIALRPADPHDLTNAQLNAHSRGQIDVVMAAKQPKGSVVANTRTLFYKGAWRTYEEYIGILRKNLWTTFFPIGIIQPQFLAGGAIGDVNAIMRGGPRFSNINDIISEFSPAKPTELQSLVFPHLDTNVMLNTVNAMWPNFNTGSIVICAGMNQQPQGWGNGSSFTNTPQTVIIVKSTGGWVVA